MKTILIAARALVYMSGFLFLWGWIAWRIRSFDQSLGVSLPAWTEIPGTLLMVLGGILVLVCAGTFVARGRGTPAPFDPPREFVAVGPYKYVRNPMYLGALSVLVGFGLYKHSASILILALGLFLFAHLFVIAYEEPTLRSQFGEAYEKYLAVPRWIPGASHR